MKRKIYLAGPWFTDEGLKTMNEIMRIVGSVNNISNYSVYFPMANQGGTPNEVFKKDIQAICDADIIIASVDEKDSGTAWELGYAFGMCKEIYLMATNAETFSRKTNLMLAFCASKRFLMKDLRDFLIDAPMQTINIPDNWQDANYDT